MRLPTSKQREQLEELMKDRYLFEKWSHLAVAEPRFQNAKLDLLIG